MTVSPKYEGWLRTFTRYPSNYKIRAVVHEKQQLRMKEVMQW
jgi:hypothetical protein